MLMKLAGVHGSCRLIDQLLLICPLSVGSALGFGFLADVVSFWRPRLRARN